MEKEEKNSKPKKYIRERDKPKRKSVKENGNKGHSTKSKHGLKRKLNVNIEDITNLALVGCSDREICHILKISTSKLEDFRGVLQEARGQLHSKIRKTQLDVAINQKNPTMLTWVGKNYLKQSDRQEVEHTGEGLQPQVVFFGERQPKAWGEGE